MWTTQVSLLLSLLLHAEVDRPLVIDQPEDELDNEYLLGTVLPSLRNLKGRRQIIFATHNPNIVVNGDADQVICLKADHECGWIHAAGAIEEPAVRRAIVDTVEPLSIRWTAGKGRFNSASSSTDSEVASTVSATFASVCPGHKAT